MGGTFSMQEETESAENFSRENQVQYLLEDMTTTRTTMIKEAVKK